MINSESIIRKILSNNITFKTENTGHYSGQSNFTLYALLDNVVVGHVDYVIFRDIPSISFIEVNKEYRGQGIGKKLVLEIQKEYPRKEIEWGMETGDGNALHNSLKSQLYVDKVKIEKKKTYEELIKQRDKLQDAMDKAYDNHDKSLITVDQLRSQTFTLSKEYDRVEAKIRALEKFLN